jgi:methyl-accepting chemotaxis protein
MKSLEQAIRDLKEKGEARGVAQAYEQELEDDRAAIKADAIVRIMARDRIAATPAEKIVETDLQYLQHRADQRASIVERFKADAEYQAAKAEATQASLITPDVLILEAENEKFSRMIEDLDRSNRDLTKKSVALMRERDDANQANRDLVRANRDLADQLAGMLGTIEGLNERADELNGRAEELQTRSVHLAERNLSLGNEVDRLNREINNAVVGRA